MGKGNRSRIERAMNETAFESKKVQAKKNKVSGAGIFVMVAAILVVVALLIGAIGVLNDGGWFARTQTVVETENYKVDGTMMNYFFMTQFNSYYEYYYQMWQSYFQSSYKSAYELMGIDSTKSLKEQTTKDADGAEVTVFDYYMGLTEDYVTRMLTYCEAAKKAGIELTEEDYADIDHSIEDLKSSFESQKALYEQFGMVYYSNFSAFLSANYGTGVKEKDVRNCLELVTLAAKFEEKLTEDEKQAILGDSTNAAVEEYVKENPSSFLMADYYAYSFSVNNKGLTDAEFEAKKAEILEKAKKLSEVADKEAYKAAVIDLLTEAEKESYRNTNWATYLKDNDNDEEKAEKALQEYFEKTYTTEWKDVKYAATLKEGYAYPSTHTDLSKWIFGFDAGEHTSDCKHEGEHEKSQDPAKTGDKTYFESTSTKEETVKKEETTTAGTTAEETTTEGAAAAAETTEGTTAEETTTGTTSSTSTSNKVKVTTYTVTVYLLEKETYRNTEITKNFGYVMFASKADAEKFYAEFQKGEINMTALKELVAKMSEEKLVTPFAYDAAEDYLPGDLQDQKVDGADKWLETAKPGECSGIVELVYTTTTTTNNKTEEKKTTYYSILVYDKDGYEAWYCDALVGATSEAVADWYEANELKLTYSTKAYKFINI